MFVLLWSTFWLRVWWRMSQFFTGLKARGVLVPPAWSYNDVVRDVLNGSRYRKDRPAGALTHPSLFYKRVLAQGKLGDCEDHGGFWLMRLLVAAEKLKVNPSLSYPNTRNHALCTVTGIDAKGKRQGHAFAVFDEVQGNGTDDVQCWADYGMPRRENMDAPHDPWWWAHEVAASYGWKLVHATRYEVPGHSRRGSIILGKMSVKKF